MYKYLLSLGSNLGYRKQNLTKAISEISKVLNDYKISSIYQSQAMLPTHFNANCDLPYLNICVTGYSILSPCDFLFIMQGIEKMLGKETHSMIWLPRTIDIDILLVDGMVSNQKHLRLPHPGLLIRDFFLVPAIEIWPDAKHPIIQVLLADIKPTIVTQLKKYEH